MAISNRARKLFDVALSVSQLSDYPRIKIGAVITKGGDIISVGFNRKKSHPFQKKYNIHRGCGDESKDYIHAEISAIVKARHQDLEGATIYVSRNNANGDRAMCRPCSACMKAIMDAGIKKIFYTSELGFEKIYLKV